MCLGLSRSRSMCQKVPLGVTWCQKGRQECPGCPACTCPQCGSSRQNDRKASPYKGVRRPQCVPVLAGLRCAGVRFPIGLNMPQRTPWPAGPAPARCAAVLSVCHSRSVRSVRFGMSRTTPYFHGQPANGAPARCPPSSLSATVHRVTTTRARSLDDCIFIQYLGEANGWDQLRTAGAARATVCGGRQVAVPMLHASARARQGGVSIPTHAARVCGRGYVRARGGV